MDGEVRFIVSGSHTGGGSLTTNLGIGFTNNSRFAIESHPAELVSVTE
jgi:hypothetical protein